jgi:general secretion pathway protein L
MSYRLYVHPVARLPSTEGEDVWHYDWILLDAGGETAAQGQQQLQADIEQTLIQNDLDQVRLIGLLPAHLVSYCRAHIPAKQSRYIRQALPFAVEEQLAQDIEALHLALGTRRGDDWDVAAIDDRHMDAWTSQFDNWNGTLLTAVYADADLIPLGDAYLGIVVEADDALIRVADGGWFRIPAEGLGMFTDSLLQRALQSDDVVKPERAVKVYGREEAMEAQRVALAALEQEEGVTVTREAIGISTVALLAHAHHAGVSDAINLCQGNYQPDTGQASLWRQWRVAAAVAGIWFLLQVGIEVGQGFYHQRHAERLEAEAVQMYRSVFPQEPGLTPQNLERRLQARLNAASTQGPNLNFLTLLRHAGYQYSVMPGRNQTQFEAINYSRRQGQLRIDVRADAFSRLDSLKTGLEQAGLQAQIGSVVNEATGARGRITVSGG